MGPLDGRRTFPTPSFSGVGPIRSSDMAEIVFSPMHFHFRSYALPSTCSALQVAIEAHFGHCAVRRDFNAGRERRAIAREKSEARIRESQVAEIDLSPLPVLPAFFNQRK